MNALDNELFKNPTAKYRGLPFWSWNCKLSKATVYEQLDIFKEMGFGGVIIHPRDGLDTEYLGEEYMDIVKHTVARCRELGLICWLYDDDRFPSGAADGLVTKNPAFRARHLKLTKKRLGDDFLAAYQITLENKMLTNYLRLNTEAEITEALNNNENVWFAYLELAKEEEWFQGQTYSDTMNPAAVDEFIKVTHEKYKSVLGNDFGTAASAIFTDEPRIGKCGPISKAESAEDAFVPYTDYFAEQFKLTHGIDALDIIPEYIWDRQDGDTHHRYNYHDMTMECFSRAFMDKICTWCKGNGILMTGHILGEETLRSQTTTVGDAMRTYKNMDIPGIDILIDGRELSTAKQAASVAAQYGREGVMSELYGVTNWDCTFKTYKLQGDWQAALGITIRVPHLSHMSLEGEAKRDWPASIFYQSPWYKEFPYVENHFARLNTVLTRGKRVTRIAVVHPVESMWIKEGPLDLNKDIRQKLDRSFSELTSWLLYSTLDFDYLSEALLPDQCVKYNEDQKLQVGEAAYEAVLVPDMITLRDTTLNILERFAANGGKVIFMGNIPEFVRGSKSKRATVLANKCTCIPHDKASLLDTVGYLRDVDIRSGNTTSDNLFYQLRRDIECSWLFISHVNKRDNMDIEQYTITIRGEYSLILYDTMNGEQFTMPSHVENGYTTFMWSCHSEDSLLLKLTKVKPELQEYKLRSEYKAVRKLDVINDFNRTEPNVVLLDCAYFSLDGGEIQEYEEMLRADNKLRKLCGFKEHTGSDRQPWATEEKETHNVTLYYDIYSETYTSLQLGIENPHRCQIFLNGTKADNSSVGWYVDKAIKIVNLPNINVGKNELRIELPYNQKTMLENIYLLGDFDVRLDDRKAIITKKRNYLNFGDITTQGMPFYTGNLEYLFDINVTEADEYFIRIPEFKAPAIGICIDDKNCGLIAYAPHRLSLGRLEKGTHKLKVILYGNRFNGFGVLHNANENYVWYGNGSYRTTGKDWTYDYMLRSTGIMSDIIIEM